MQEGTVYIGDYNLCVLRAFCHPTAARTENMYSAYAKNLETHTNVCISINKLYTISDEVYRPFKPTSVTDFDPNEDYGVIVDSRMVLHRISGMADGMYNFFNFAFALRFYHGDQRGAQSENSKGGASFFFTPPTHPILT